MKSGKDNKKSKTEYVRNVDKRKKFIEQFGEDRFQKVCKTSKEWADLREYAVPPEYEWIWWNFLEIWHNCEVDFCGNRVFTYGTINDYVQCMNVPLSIDDKRLLLKIKDWANEQISMMKDKD